MGVFEHRQTFAAIQLHGEFGAESVKELLPLQGGENLSGQFSRVEQHLPVDACARAHHQITHIVARRMRRAKARGEQTFDQRGLLMFDATNLQVGPVSGLDHRAGITLRALGNGVGLLGTEGAAGEFYPADTAISGLDDTQQPRTGRGA